VVGIFAFGLVFAFGSWSHLGWHSRLDGGLYLCLGSHLGGVHGRILGGRRGYGVHGRSQMHGGLAVNMEPAGCACGTVRKGVQGSIPKTLNLAHQAYYC